MSLIEQIDLTLFESSYTGIIRQIERKAGASLNVEISQYSGIKIEGKRDGLPLSSFYFRASPVAGRGYEYEGLNAKCRDFAEKEQKTLWVIRGANLPEELRGKGIGTLAYEALAAYVEKQDGILAPHSCLKGGSTSPDALRVWKSLERKGYSVVHP